MTDWNKKLELDSPASVGRVTGLIEPPAPAAEPTVSEAALETLQVQELSRTNLDFLAALVMPLIFRYCFPPVFKSIWTWLLSYIHRERDFSQLAIGLPRGFGKTMLIKLFILYVVLFTKRKFILIICGTQTKANNIIADITAMLCESNVLKVFGDFRVGSITDRQELQRFGFRGRNIILMGAGAQSDIRGTTLENERPDLMVFDDIQTREDADSQVVSEKLETWMFGTAMKAKSPHGCLFIFIANMYPTKWSILRRLKSNPTWTKFIAGGILADGTSLWEELQPINQLIQEYANDLAAGRPEVFFAEVLNDENASVNNFIDIGKIPENPYTDDAYCQGSYIIIDPATDKINADAVSIGYFEVFDEKDVATEIIEGRLSPGETCEQAIRLALRRNCRLIAIESNAFQYVLGWIMRNMLTQYGITGIEVVEIYSGISSKNSRILTMFKQLLSGEILLHPTVRALVCSQIIQFNPLRRDNADGILDLLCYAPRVRQQFGEYIVSNLTLEAQEFYSLQVHDESVTSPF